MSDPAIPAPRPLTDDELPEALDDDLTSELSLAFSVDDSDEARDYIHDIIRTIAPFINRELATLQAEVESLRTRLAATTTQRDAAYSVVQRTRDNWEPVLKERIWRRYFFTQVAPKLVANHEDEPMTPDEAAVLDTTRDTHDA